MENLSPQNVDHYIAQFPPATQDLLQTLRETIRLSAPEAREVMSYRMPAYSQNGILVYFAAYRKHIGFYPTGVGITQFQSEFGDLKWSKGAVQFPLDQPLPLDLVRRIVAFKLDYNLSNCK
jgi:uncharacterized protein YdhG (YjbR/CyaY superfamily)